MTRQNILFLVAQTFLFFLTTIPTIIQSSIYTSWYCSPFLFAFNISGYSQVLESPFLHHILNFIHFLIIISSFFKYFSHFKRSSHAIHYIFLWNYIYIKVSPTSVSKISLIHCLVGGIMLHMRSSLLFSFLN